MSDPIKNFMDITEKTAFEIGWIKGIYYMQLLMEEEFGETIEPRINEEEAYKRWKEEGSGYQYSRNIRERV